MLHITRGITSPVLAQSADATGAGVDFQTCDNNCFAIQVVGTVAGTELTFLGKIQEAVTLTGTYADVSGAAFSTVTSTTGVGGIQLISFQRTQPFLRYVGDIAGTTSTVALDVLIGGQKKQY